MPSTQELVPSSYGATLKATKKRVQQERVRAVLAANSAMVLLYWDIGRLILERQSREGWGAKVIDRLARDLQKSFPDMQGLSSRNLLFMRRFAEEFPDTAIVKQLVSQLPWGHVIRLVQMVKAPQARAISAACRRSRNSKLSLGAKRTACERSQTTPIAMPVVA